MVDVAKVSIWGEDLGALSWDRERKIGSFEFFPDFLHNKWDVSPIHMPLSSGKGRIYSFPNLNEQTYKGLPGLLSDVLPDDFGNRLIDNWLSINKINSIEFTPLDRLCYIGKRGMGALEFEPSIHKYPSESTPLDIQKLIDLAQKIVNARKILKLNAHETSSLNELLKVGSSAGGQRPKAIIAYNKQTSELRSGQTDALPGFEHYIFKFDGVSNQELGDPKGFGRIEFAYYKMAIDCGIEMSNSMLLEESGRAHFMTKRFDRVNENEKLHMQTLCSLAHFDYKAAGVYSYENAFEIMRALRLTQKEIEQQYKRMIFNVVARNQDDHTKNISFLMSKAGKWSLSPAYDVTYSYNPTGVWTNQHQMTINGKRDEFKLYDLIEVGERASLKNSKAIVEQTISMVSTWNKYAKEAGISIKQAKAIEKAHRLKFG
jgi:serine/threonine-protein kinase HipA